MAESRCSCPVLLIPLLAGLTSGSEDYAKIVCSGDSIQMFKSIQINNSDTTVTLYKNGDKHRPIAWLTSINYRINQENVVLDEHKNIWIMNAHLSDEGSYIIKYDIRNSHPLEIEVKLLVLVAPNTTCKPTIKRAGNVLKASLEGDDCGKPKASVYWLKYLGVIYEGTDLVKLQSGREAGIYYACIEGPAISCIRKSYQSTDHCYPFQIEESIIQPDSGGSKIPASTDDSKDILYWMIGAVIVLQIVPSVLLAIYAVLKLYRMCKERKESIRPNGENQDAEELLAMGNAASLDSADAGNVDTTPV